MKKVLLLIVALLAVSAGFAFKAGDLLLGGQVGITSEQVSPDHPTITTIEVHPQVGLFILKEFSLDLILSRHHVMSENYRRSTFGVAFGSRYFYKQFYGGLEMRIATFDEYRATGHVRYKGAQIGNKLVYLVPITSAAYLDLQAHFSLGNTEYGDEALENEDAIDYGLRAGIQFLLGQ